MSTHTTHPLPTHSQLFKATGAALIAAGAILVAAVLPAEHGIDPTGIGKALGLTALSAAATTSEAALPLPVAATATPPANAEAAAPVAQTATVAKSELPLLSDEMQLTLQPGEGAEIKAAMREGAQFVFTWTTEGGKVNFDMHGERPNAGDEFTSYWKAMQQTGAQGAFVAPFDGTHGWYWRNRGDQPVVVKLKVSGFYETLYRPK